MSNGWCVPNGASEYAIERHVVDSAGRLGSLYNLRSDRVVDQYSPPRLMSKRVGKPAICQILSGHPAKSATSYLEQLGFQSSLRENVDFQTVAPAGLSLLIDYNEPITRGTRFLYYSYRDRKEKLEVKAGKGDHVAPPPQANTFATHMITKIVWGIEILCVLQIPPNQYMELVDQTLERVRRQLLKYKRPMKFNPTDQSLLEKLSDTAIYGSETCIDQPNMSLTTVLSRIREWQNNVNVHQPIEYTLLPLRWLYPRLPAPDPPELLNEKDSHLRRVRPLLKRIAEQIEELREVVADLPDRFSSPILHRCLIDEQRDFEAVIDAEQELSRRLRTVMEEIQQGRQDSSIIDTVIASPRYASLNAAAITQLQTKLARLVSKAKLIDQLTDDGIRYINATDVYRSGQTAETQITDIHQVLIRTLSKAVLWYSSDRLRREQVDQWKENYQRLLVQKDRREPLDMIYVDFTYCQPNLEDFMMVEVPVKKTPEMKKEDRTSTTDSDLNVLLVGESGVGKSTFINAFVNYLAFETLEQAEQDRPIVVIPVSFITTINDQFEQFEVKFGDSDPNEDHQRVGQSVTQQCRSYVFDIHRHLRLRLIDTPGIGDSRGLDQDTKNIDHIFTYVQNFSHLNAICFLLKPNQSRLDAFFRVCLKQLFTFFTPTSHPNILFCFTNTRSTFFAPGDTAPLLRQLLVEEQLTEVQFNPNNSFCFDSEAFRYLVAKRAGLQFTESIREESKKSWIRSVAASERFFARIQTLTPSQLGQLQSTRKVMLQIFMLARPLMETLRLILYNWKLREANIIGHQIVLESQPLTSDLCTHCARVEIVEIGSLSITQYSLDRTRQESHLHQRCPTDGKHFFIESLVQHASVQEPAGLSVERWQSSFKNFLYRCDRLTHFLRQQGSLAHGDPFEVILNRFRDEEQQIVQVRSSSNRRVGNFYASLKQMRQANAQQLVNAKERLTLNEVTRIIDECQALATVKKQIEVVETSRRLKMKAQELTIEADLIRNQRFTSVLDSDL